MSLYLIMTGVSDMTLALYKSKISSRNSKAHSANILKILKAIHHWEEKALSFLAMYAVENNRWPISDFLT